MEFLILEKSERERKEGEEEREKERERERERESGEDRSFLLGVRRIQAGG
jgi:hypothetical protein